MVMNRDVVVLSSEQFDKLVELLTPGYEMAKAWQAEMAQRAAQSDEKPTVTTFDEGGAGAQTGEANPMDQGQGAPLFRKSAPPPDFDDPSKQGSG